MLKDLTELNWVELSDLATRSSKKELLQYMSNETRGLARPHVLRRFFGAFRKKQLKEDKAVLAKGKLPEWLDSFL